MSKFLDEYGLARVWQNIKSYIQSQTMPISYLTSSEYDVLPSTQKNHGLYFVTSAPMQVGETVSWAGYDWIVVNDNGDDTVVLAMSYIYELTAFGSNNTYAGSTLENKAKAFENSLPDFILNQAVNTTVESVTAKIFVPTFAQISGGFSYFNSNQSRISQFNGNAMQWFSCERYKSNSSKVYGVNTVGELAVLQIDSTFGFRPFVTLKQLESKTTVYLNGNQISL